MKNLTQKYTKTPTLQKIQRHKGDMSLMMVCLALMTLGLILVISISSGLAQVQNTDSSKIILKSIVYVVSSIVVFCLSAVIGPKLFFKFANIGMILAVIMSVVLVFTGQNINGAKRWLDLGFTTIQVAEIFKIAILFFTANYIGQKFVANSPESNKNLLKIGALISGIVAIFVIVLQKDLGSGMVILAMSLGMIYFAGIDLKFVGILIIPLLVFLVLSTILTSHRKERIISFGSRSLTECNDANFQQCQAGLAIGSGSWFGRGLAGGVQAFGYLPESHNDAIFAVYAEKTGFVGVFALLATYYYLVKRMYRIILRTVDKTQAAFVAGVMLWISSQMIINVIGMLNLSPLKGITLPFVSSGGTSIIILSAAAGMCFYVSKFTKE